MRFQDHELIEDLAHRGLHGLVTCDDAMIFRPEVLAAVARFRFSVVTCRRVGHDAVRDARRAE